MKVVDVHVHVGHRREWIPQGLELAEEHADARTLELIGPEGPTGDVVSKYLEETGISFGVAIPCGRQAVQEYTIEEAEKSPGRLIPFVQYDPRNAPEAPDLFRLAIARGARGLKVHPASNQIAPNHRSLYPLYDVALEHELPVMFHVGSSIFPGTKLKYCDPLLIDEVAADFPGLKLICAHAGRGFWEHQVLALARMRPNVYIEFSGVPPTQIPDKYPQLEKVADQVLFGSDWPASPAPSTLIEKFCSLPFASEFIEKAMWRNADSLLNLGMAQQRWNPPRDPQPNVKQGPV